MITRLRGITKMTTKRKSCKMHALSTFQHMHDVWEECKHDDKNVELLMCKELVEARMGIPCDKGGLLAVHVQRALKRSVLPVSCVYLFSLGVVKNMREAFEIDDSVDNESYVCKYGMTKNLESRISEHTNDYGKMANVTLRLLVYAQLDATFVNEAEGDLRLFFSSMNMKLVTKGRNELVVVSAKQFKVVENQYKLIANTYTNRIERLQQKIQDLENEKEIQRLHLERANLSCALHNRIHELELQVAKLENGC